MGDSDRLWIPLTKHSLGVVKNNPKLLVFPVLSGLVWLAFLGVIVRVAIELGLSTLENFPVLGALLFCLYFGSMFVFTFFAAGLVHETRDVLADGSKPSLWSGLAAAWHAKLSVLVWAFVGTAARAAISALTRTSGAERSKNRRLTRNTFFIVPVMVFERPSVGELYFVSKDRLAEMREQKRLDFVGIEMLGIYFVCLFGLLGLLVVLASFATDFLTLRVPAAVVVVLLGVTLGFLLRQTIHAIMKTGLYLYTTEDRVPEAFETTDFQ